MSTKAPSVVRKPTTRPNQFNNKKAAKIYRQSEVFRRKNDWMDESGTPSPSPALIAEQPSARPQFSSLGCMRV